MVEGTTALGWAVREKHLDVIYFLLDNGADAKLSDKYNRSPIMVAIAAHDWELVKILIAHSDMDQKDYSGKSVLDYGFRW